MAIEYQSCVMAVPEAVLERMDEDSPHGLMSETPQRDRFQVSQRSASLRITLMQQAWVREGLDRDDPPELTQVYFPTEGLLVIDLNSGGGDSA